MNEDHVITTIDVRLIRPKQRHPLIFKTFDALQPGEALLLITNHAPRPLYYQLRLGRNHQFQWEYLEEGPAVWQVRIRKQA